MGASEVENATILASATSKASALEEAVAVLEAQIRALKADSLAAGRKVRSRPTLVICGVCVCSVSFMLLFPSSPPLVMLSLSIRARDSLKFYPFVGYSQMD